jgi:hypothetical protein
MAKINYDIDRKNISEYPNSFKRQGAFPLENFEIFEFLEADKSNPLETAEGYAQSDLAYVGQIIKVIGDTDSNNGVYCIKDENGKLEKIAIQSNVDEINEKLETLESFIGDTSEEGLTQSIINTVLDNSTSEDTELMPFDPTGLTDEDKNKLVT